MDNKIMNHENILESRKTLLKEHKERINMHDEKQKEDNKNGELKENMISRLTNWKFNQALNYRDALKYEDSIECLEWLEKLWGDTGWDRGDTIFGGIIKYLVEFIRLKEGWTYKEFYDEEEEIDVI